MLHRTYTDQDCSVARALEVVGERWTILILRDAFRGVHRFDDFQRSLGVARNVLQTRLLRLVDEGLLERWRYQEHPPRHEYRLTPRGEDLWPVLLALMAWGDLHRSESEAAPRAVHRGCGGALVQRCSCRSCEAQIGVDEVELRYAIAPLLDHTHGETAGPRDDIAPLLDRTHGENTAGPRDDSSDTYAAWS